MTFSYSKSIVFLLFCLVCFASCVEPYDQSFRTSNKIIIIEGLLSNSTGLSPITIKESLPSASGGSNITLIVGAKVSVIINSKTTLTLTEKQDGQYSFDSNFKGEIGSTYQLKFTTPDGNTFESAIEKLEDVSPIAKVYHQLDIEAIKDVKGNTTPGYKVYIDTNDPTNVENQYLWAWTLFEKQNVCQTCTGGYYYRTPAPNGACVEDALLKRYNNIFDYFCEGSCWEIIRSIDLVANSDEFYNGKTIKGQLVGNIPIYQSTPSLLEISQYAISREAFKFIKLSQQQGIETGGLADTPPAALIGNVKCVNDPTINTSGYFIVGGKTTSRYWLDKKDVVDQRIQPVGLLGGRSVKYEPSGPNTTRPPLAPCIQSYNRTNQQPLGWIN